MRRLVLAIALLLSVCLPLVAEAVGPLVGTNCSISETAPTTYSDGAPLPVGLALTYEWFIMNGVQTLPAIPPKFTSAGPTLPNACAGLAAGQYTAGNDIIDVATGLKSGFSNMFPFMLVIPNVPAGFACTPAGVCSWTPPTTYTDNTTPIPAGGASTEIWVMPATATAPSGPPTLVATGTSVPISPPAGSYNVFARALTTPTPGGSTSESAVVSSPFVSRTLNPGTNLLVR